MQSFKSAVKKGIRETGAKLDEVDRYNFQGSVQVIVQQGYLLHSYLWIGIWGDIWIYCYRQLVSLANLWNILLEL